MQRSNQKEFRIEKILKRKSDKLYVKWKGCNNSFNSWINKKDIKMKMSQYFPKLLRSYGENIKVKIDLSNYATKADIKNITHVNTSHFASKTNLVKLKTEVDKLDIGKLKTVPVDLSNLYNVVKNEVIKKTEYNKLVNKINNIDTSRFILKTKYDADKLELEKKNS